MAVGIIDKGPGSMAARIGSRSLAWLISINIIVSLVIWTCALFSGGRVRIEDWLGLPGSWTGFCRQPWGIATYMVSQTGILHLLFNLLWLLCFGRIALMVMLDRQLTFLYVGGGLAGGLAFLIWNALSPTGSLLLGASASVMSLMVATAVYRPKLRLNLWLIGEVGIITITVISILLTFLGAGGGNGGGQAAHIGGLIFGVWAGLMMCRQKDPSRIPDVIKSSLERRRAEWRSRREAKVRRADEALLTGIRGRLADRERLDELLDKIRASGYASLTRSEKAELNALSNRLDSGPRIEEEN